MTTGTSDRSAAERLWQSARFLPESALLLGIRYKALFLIYAPSVKPEGKNPAVADALAFADFMLRQKRVTLIPTEISALRRDIRRLRRRYLLTSRDGCVTATEKSRLRRWLGF